MFPTIGALALPKSHWAAGPITGDVAASIVVPTAAPRPSSNSRSPADYAAACRAHVLLDLDRVERVARALVLGQRKPDEFVYASRRIERARSWCSVHFHPPRRWGSGS